MSARAALRALTMSVAHGAGLAAAARTVGRTRARLASPSIRVMNLHGTPSRYADQFRDQLLWVARTFEVLEPAVLFRIMRRELSPPSTPAVVFTFDDGLRSNAAVAAPLLESLGTKGLFFVCPGFSQLTGNAAKRFYYERIDPTGKPSDDAESWTPMSRHDVVALHRAGHVVGNHTLSHARLSTVADDALSTEIDAAAAMLEAWTGARCESFAWTFAWNAISPAAHRAAIARHAFCFAACPGSNSATRMNAHLIWRTHVEPGWPIPEYAFVYSGLVDPIWAGRRRALRALLAT